MLDAFRVLSDHNILHRDIKPSNILFNNGVIKLADFGFCKLLAPNEMANTMVGSPIYMAPEILKGSPYTTKADIWSFGVVLYECLYGFCPYEDKSIGRLIKMIDNKDLYFPPVPKISRELTDVIKKMLTVIPSKRISWQELLQSEVFKQQPPKSNLFLNKLQDIEFYKSVESPRITSRSEE
jgi:serine/threonine protein kinase